MVDTPFIDEPFVVRPFEEVPLVVTALASDFKTFLTGLGATDVDAGLDAASGFRAETVDVLEAVVVFAVLRPPVLTFLDIALEVLGRKVDVDAADRARVDDGLLKVDDPFVATCLPTVLVAREEVTGRVVAFTPFVVGRGAAVTFEAVELLTLFVDAGTRAVAVSGRVGGSFAAAVEAVLGTLGFGGAVAGFLAVVVVAVLDATLTTAGLEVLVLFFVAGLGAVADTPGFAVCGAAAFRTVLLVPVFAGAGFEPVFF